MSIDSYANGVNKVVIPKNVVQIADNALASLKKLGSAVFEGNAPRVASGAKSFGEQAEYFYIIPGQNLKASMKKHGAVILFIRALTLQVI